MDRQTLKSNARIALAEHRWISVLALLINSALISAASMIPGGGLVLTGVLTFGSTAFFLRKTNDLMFLFKGFNNFVKTFLAGLLQQLYISLWTLLFIIPGIVKTYSYAMTYYILNDHPELSANEAITKSREMMDGHKWDLFVLQLSFLGWDLLGMLTFGILNVLYVNPYRQYAMAEFYNSIKGE